MANLFIGFPVPRAKIADMIEGSAPPLEHAANHLPAGSDQIVLSTDIETNQIVKWNGIKFIGAAAPGASVVLSPISIPACNFRTQDESITFDVTKSLIKAGVTTPGTTILAPVFFPHGVTVTKVTLFGWRDDASAEMVLYLFRCSNLGATGTMASITADWADGDGSLADDSISNPVIDNEAYSCLLQCYLDPNDAVNDVQLKRVMIEFS